MLDANGKTWEFGVKREIYAHNQTREDHMENGDQITIIRESNGSDVPATYIAHDETGMHFIRANDDVCWFMPWHSIRAVRLDSATEDMHREKKGDDA